MMPEKERAQIWPGVPSNKICAAVRHYIAASKISNVALAFQDGFAY